MSVDITRSRQAAVDRRMRERDELIELIREALNANGYVVDRGYVAMADIRDAADAVLAGGWRKVDPLCATQCWVV
jgi:mannitol/fructose-specific phosphotransferase system IIA component